MPIRPAFLALLLVSASASAQDSYTIQLHEPGPGECARVEKTEKTSGATRLVDGQGKVVVNHQEDTVTRVVYEETVLEKNGDARPSRLRRRYEKAETATGGRSHDLVYAGKTVLIEKKDGKYRFTLDNEALKPEDAKLLEQEFNGDTDPAAFERLLLPGKPVAVGKAWQVNLGPLLKEFERGSKVEAVAAKATGAGTLEKVYEKGGHRFGKLTIDVQMPLKALGEGKQRVDVQAGSKASFDVLMDVCIDGQHQGGAVRGTFKLNADAAVTLPEGGAGKLTVRVEAVTEETRKELPRVKP
jgi:hypothetical protein